MDLARWSERRIRRPDDRYRDPSRSRSGRTAVFLEQRPAPGPPASGSWNLDGGPGAPSDAAGSGETDLDVEQSGGIAPDANVIVYQAPNTDNGFADGFFQAASQNIAGSVSRVGESPRPSFRQPWPRVKRRPPTKPPSTRRSSNSLIRDKRVLSAAGDL